MTTRDPKVIAFAERELTRLVTLLLELGEQQAHIERDLIRLLEALRGEHQPERRVA